MDERLKFRAWLKKEKKMVTVVKIDFNNRMIYYEYSETDRALMVVDFDEVILMQCTGLADKNGNLIFEGDIIKNDIAVGIVKFGNPDLFEGSRCSMFYWQITEWLNHEYSCFEDDAFTEFKNTKIIGNIYENPELIEERQE